ncbi:HlyD family efflux transporter periplasmic adaptor subunit [Alteromonas sediminis]|uniref:HlyD family efflux transporter periplasmic adaptor subunit n=1 Tax=Alteromonas sediminis TaxID=2259342 RepID=A0A3N5Y4N7_9ALTE|nr:efflux RND transporter periplasmic adaptor subunit [Alteromonas sediminis]RPJ67846.1 HlyD family efflux transporter periplasmic adaptor subunit [Alteromonas sediminis]
MRSLVLVLSLLVMAACSEQAAEKAVESTLKKGVYAPAELVSLQEISLTPPNIPRTWEYKIEFLARENDLVKEGDLLIRFDGQRLRTQLLERQSELNAEKKEAENKKLSNEAKLEQLILDMAEAKKNQDIARRKVEITDVSRSEIERRKQQSEFVIATELYEQAVARVEKHKQIMVLDEQVQQAKIDKAQSRVDQINDSIAKLSVTAPKAGMVTLIPNGDGDKPAVGDTVFMGARILALPSLEMIAVKVEFDESTTSQVNLGDTVRVTLDGYPERPFAGQISEIGQSYRQKSTNNQKVVFDAWVELEQMDLNIMRPGMKATVELAKVAS